MILLIYNFTYRLSGNRDVAGILTEKVLLTLPANQHNNMILLKQAWEDFLIYYGSFDFKGEDVLQQAILSLLPEPRCAIILRDIFGYSYRQIAVILNKSDAAVGSIISLARREIAKKYIKVQEP